MLVGVSVRACSESAKRTVSGGAEITGHHLSATSTCTHYEPCVLLRSGYEVTTAAASALANITLLCCTDNMDKSMSESDLDSINTGKTPPNFVFTRNSKRRRDDDDYAVEFDSLKEEMRELVMTLFAKQKEEFKDLLPTLKEIKQVNSNIENSIAFLTMQNEDLKKKIDVLENQSKDDKKQIKLLEDKIEDLQKVQRKCNFEIKNVPKKVKEDKSDLLEMVTHLAKNVGCSISSTDIKDIYRVRGNKVDAKNTAIVVETNSTMVKTEVIKMTKQFNIKNKTKLCAKHLGFRSQEDTPVFITEHLTRYASRLHFLARDLAKSKEYKYCWTAYGRVYVRKSDNSPIINITSESQVQNLLNSTDK